METILVLIHTDAKGSAPSAALETITAAKSLIDNLGQGILKIGLVGETVNAAVEQVSSCGAEKVYTVSGADFGAARYCTDSAAITALVQAAKPSLVFAPATSRWNRSVPGAAFRTQGKVDTHVTGVNAKAGVVNISRWYYRQRMEAVIDRAQRPWFLLIEAGCYQPWSGTPVASAPEPVAVPNLKIRTQTVGVQSPRQDQQTIRPEAKILLVTGAGWTKKQADGQIHAKEAEGLILGFLNQTGASLGSSKSLVDLSGEGQAVLPFLTHLNQIGQTGSTPRHPKGLATCCHGEEPHSVGWRFIDERRAVNLDANCGWARGKADVLYVADAFKVMAKVNELLSQLPR